jgi:hypothetical protein
MKKVLTLIALLSALQYVLSENIYVKVYAVKNDDIAILEPDIFPVEIDDTTIKSTLAGYGFWATTEEYGIVWKPFVAINDSQWRPYCHNGRWIITNHGHFWHSYYPWGWIVFHYGRWNLHPQLGWVWVPGKYWGPAWVIWRSSSNYCGWAPIPFYDESDTYIDIAIPPDFFTFVPVHRIYMPCVVPYILPRNNYINIYHQTVIVQNPDRRATSASPSVRCSQPERVIIQIPHETTITPDSRTIRVLSAMPPTRVTMPSVNNSLPISVSSKEGRLERIINVLSSSHAVISQTATTGYSSVCKNSATSTSSPGQPLNKTNKSPGSNSSTASRISRIINTLSSGR